MQAVMGFITNLLTATALVAPSSGAFTSRYSVPSYGSSSGTTTCAATVTPTYAFSSFSYTQLTSNRYATPVSSPVSYTTSYGPSFGKASKLLPTSVTYTSYSLNPSATETDDGQYGQSAYNALWAPYTYTDTVPFTTTRSPTPVASSELIYPPPLYTACPSTDGACLSCYKFPADFVWGVAGSASQIEGGSQSEGRGPSALDIFGDQAIPPLASRASFVVADMNYFLYKQDILRLAAIGVPYYSFSISWSRIVPFGTAGSPLNQQAIDHYDDLIKFCLKHGVKPIITLMHVDNPATTDLSNSTSFRTDFLYYAQQVLTRWSSVVPYWITFNEPNIEVPYFSTNYNVLTSFLLAHADVWHWYHSTLNGTGLMSLKLANNLAVPLTTAAHDTSAALRYQDFLVGTIGSPLFLGLQYPSSVLSTVALTPLTSTELAHIAHAIDFLAIDPYVAQFASAPPGGIAACAGNASNAYWPQCVVLSNVQANGWLMGQASDAYAYIAPQYVRQQLGYLWNTFRPAGGILIAEFGFNVFAEAQETLDAERYDLARSLYYEEFLRETLKAVWEDGVKVVGALAWSFVDNNEFGSYSQHYGMQAVNRTDGGAFERTFKRSFFDFVDFFHQRVG